MLKRTRVDREDELILLGKIAVGEIAQRILLISGDAGMGKSELLREFISNCPSDVLVVAIDFKNGSVSQVDLLCTICETLGWSLFPRTESALRSLLELPNVNISGNVMIGHNSLNILFNRFDRQTSAVYFPSLTKAFFVDLRNLDRVVFIYDTFENADPLLREWVMNVFLHNVQAAPHLAVIISGRDVPEPALGWSDICSSIKLRGIEPIHWYRYAQSIGSTVDLDFIEACCSAINMQTLKMAEILSIYLERGGER